MPHGHTVTTIAGSGPAGELCCMLYPSLSRLVPVCLFPNAMLKNQISMPLTNRNAGIYGFMISINLDRLPSCCTFSFSYAVCHSLIRHLGCTMHILKYSSMTQKSYLSTILILTQVWPNCCPRAKAGPP